MINDRGVVMENCLIYFRNPGEFLDFETSLGVYNGWKIASGLMNTRGEAVRNKFYTIRLRQMFNDNNLFRRQVSIAEIVSWLDTMIHLKRIVKALFQRLCKEKYLKLEIIFEYVIEHSKKSRIDVVFKYDSNYCLFEFRTVDDFKKIKSNFDKKRIELMIYKDMLQNYIEYPSKIIVFPFIGLFEFKNNSMVNAHIDYNIKQVEFTCDYITSFLIK
jgi:hypothetical protein